MSKKHWEAYFNAVKKQDWKGILEALNSILKKEPSNPQVHLKIGDVFQKTGNRSGAVAAYHQAAGLFINQGFLQKALAIFKIILRLDPRNGDALKKSKGLIIEIESSKTQATTASPETIPIPPLEVQEQTRVEVPPKTELKRAAPHIPPLFAPLPEDERNRLIDRIQPKFFSSGQAIVEEGDFGDSIFIIQSGHAKVVIHILGKEIELATLSEGDIFGEVAFLTGRPRTASVIAIDTVEVLELDRFLLEEVFEKYPDVLKKLHDFYQHRVHDTLIKVKSEIKK